MGKRVARSRYNRLPDSVIAGLAQACDRGAVEYLLYKYRTLVRTKIRSYFLLGAEKDDLLQIGMIGLWQAIMDYSATRDISFVSFARICIERHVITAIKTATRQKQSPLNNAISLEYATEDDDSDFCLTEVLVCGEDLDPAGLLLRREESQALRQALRILLSDFEWEVLKRYNVGKTYREIAHDLACGTKSIDNALGRIKRKVASTPEAVLSY
jgi:RNA polymerase sporulation-specific sigma factor